MASQPWLAAVHTGQAFFPQFNIFSDLFLFRFTGCYQTSPHSIMKSWINVYRNSLQQLSLTIPKRPEKCISEFFTNAVQSDVSCMITSGCGVFLKRRGKEAAIPITLPAKLWNVIQGCKTAEMGTGHCCWWTEVSVLTDSNKSLNRVFLFWWHSFQSWLSDGPSGLINFMRPFLNDFIYWV